MSDTKQTPNKVTLRQIFSQLKFWLVYLFSKKIVILVFGILGGLSGITYAWLQKPIYKAELTFAPETSGSKMEGYASIAAQFGFNIGGGGGNLFEGENILELLKSSALITNALFTKTTILGKEETLINYRIRTNASKNKKLLEQIEASHIDFNATPKTTVGVVGERVGDSVVKIICKEVLKSLTIEKTDKKNTIIRVAFEDKDEIFAKAFVETLTQNAINYYADYKTKKAKQNVDVLQFQADSVKRMLFGGIEDVASLNDVNVNPLKQSARVGTQKRTIDVQVNGALYTEILKNLELSKIALRRETPFMQVIDRPYYPLEKKKLGRLLGGIIGGLLAGVISVAFLILKKLFVLFSLKMA